jgi:ActR/RegA family two-component response regulator
VSVGSTLLVSNDAATIQQLTESMQQLAMSPEICVEVPAALLLLNRRKFEAVIVDLQLGQAAKTVLEQVRRSPSNRTAVTFTISNSEAETAIAFAAGSSFVLERPLSTTSISRTLKAAYGLIVRERRRYFRCPVEIPATMRRQDGPEVNCRTVNISEGGIAMSTSVPLRPGVQVQVQFTLPGQQSELAAESTVRWWERDHLGLQFLALFSEQKSELQEWLSRRLEQNLPESVAERFRKAALP